MNIVIFGAGAIGSLFGSFLSKKNNVLLVGKRPHIQAIKKKGLKITGKTKMHVKISAEESVDDVTFTPDLLVLTVKSYDTETAIKEAKSIIGDSTIVLSLQNGLDNVDKIEKIIDCKQIIAGVTTHGAFFSEPGMIKHTGKGETVLGELTRQKSARLDSIVDVFNGVGIETIVSEDIIKEMWVKAIVNSSINPLTTLFQCKNGYLIENPLLENVVGKICMESAMIVNKIGIRLSHQDVYKKTKQVIQNTAGNYSSMFQSFKRGKKTEVDSINGRIVDIGRKHGIEPLMNEILFHSIKSMCGDNI